MRLRRSLLVLTVGAVALSGCGGGSTPAASPAGSGGAAPAGAAKAGGTMVVGLAEDPDVLDPSLSRSLVGREVYVNLCEKLYDLTPDLQVQPQLAAALPTVSADGKTVTIKVRSGAKFNDGTPLDAAAVKTSLDRHKSIKGSARASELSAVDTITVVDPATVRLTLSKPYSPLTAQLTDRSGMILSPTQLTKLGDKFGSSPVCVAPFSFVSRTPGSEIVLQKATNYYDADKVKLDKLVFRIITDSNVRLANLRSGDVQAAERLAPTDIKSVESDANLRLISSDSLGYQGLTINVGNVNGNKQPFGQTTTPLGKSPELRKAFELSLDRDGINGVVFSGRFQPDCSPLSPKSPYRSPEINCPKRDVAAAKALIAKSGVATPVPVKLMIGTSPTNARLGAVIQSMAKEAGFDVQLQPTEFATLLDLTDAGKFDVVQLGWSGRIDPDGNTYNFIHTKGSQNIGGLSDPKIDAALLEARGITDQAKRKDLYTAALQQQDADKSLIYLYHERNYLGTGKKVTGIVYFGDGLPRMKTAALTD